MPKILFPTDFSDNAKNAFVYAINLAKKIGAEITTLHVYEKPKIPGIERMPVTGEEIYEGIKSEVFEEYRQQIPGYREIAEEMQASNITIKHELKEGLMVRTICRFAYDMEADFIIMGTKGASGLKEIFLGTFTSEIMEKAPCPVLGIPEKARLNKIDKIGVTYNFAKDRPALIDTTLTVS